MAKWADRAIGYVEQTVAVEGASLREDARRRLVLQAVLALSEWLRAMGTRPLDEVHWQEYVEGYCRARCRPRCGP